MEKHESEQIIKETIEFASKEVKKSKRRSICLVGGVLLSVLLLLGGYFLAFVHESPVAYREGLVEVAIPADGGIDIHVTLANYKGAKAVLVETGDSSYDLYIGITRTIASRLVKDADPTNNFLRAGNGLLIDYQSGRLLGHLPGEAEENMIRRIYYIDDLPDEIAAMSDPELIEHENKTLIWTRAN